MRLVVLLAMLLVTDYVAASGRRLDPEQAATRVDTTAVRSRMADIEMHLGCGATATETIYVYQPNLTAQEGLSLAPSILVSGRGVELLATPRHPGRERVRSVRVSRGSDKATIAREAHTGTDEFVTDSRFRAVMLDAPGDGQVHAKLYADSTLAEFSLSDGERKTWRDIIYYFANFAYRTGNLPRVPSRPKGVITESSFDAKPKPVSMPKPYYPEHVKAAGIEAQVVVEALLDTVGSVRTALVLNPQGHESLELAAVRAALDATFEPARARGKPVPAWPVCLPYRFVLD